MPAEHKGADGTPPASGSATTGWHRLQHRAALIDLVQQSADTGRSVLVVVPRASAARALRSELGRRLPERSGFVHVLTPVGFSTALLRAGRAGLHLLAGTKLRAVVAELLRSEGALADASVLWPTQYRFLGGPAFLDELVHEVRNRTHSAVEHETTGGRRRELLAFLGRYEARLAADDVVDGPRALHCATERLLAADALPNGLDPTGGVVVEDAALFRDGAARLVRAIGDRAEQRGVPVTMSLEPPAAPPPPVVAADARCELLRIHHPAIQADAIASVLRQWIDAGRSVGQLAVVLPQPDSVLRSELHCAATRVGVPLVVAGTRLGDSPIVEECAGAAANGPDDAQATHVAGLAFAWWLDHAAELLGDRLSVALISAFISALTAGDSIADALDRRSPSTIDCGVAVLSLDDAADRPSDDPWQGVVLVGCVDGTFPRRRARPRWFAEESGGTSGAAGRADDNDEDALVSRDRQRLANLLEAVAANGHVVAVAAPVGGVLTSSFVDGWPRRELSLLRSSGVTPPRPPVETSSEVPLFPTGSLRLSATQLSTFEDCSWRYGFEYGLGLRGAGGASATAGSLVHAVLESFLSTRPDDVELRTRSRLFELLDELWSQDEFPYAAQAFDYRRRAEQWLGNWWEFFCEVAPDVRLTEHRFEVPFPAVEQPPDTTPEVGARHTLVGSIDRVDVIGGDSSRSEHRTRVVDYKSGSPKSVADVADDLQLAVYHYAATHDPIVRALGRPDRLELHYLQDDASKERVKVMSRPVTDDLEAQTVARIGALADAILEENYRPNPDANCDYCAFHVLCPTKQQGRNVR